MTRRRTDMDLTELTKALRNTDEIEITVTGRTSGRKISNPVWFVQEDQKLYLLPVKGSDTGWYKNVSKAPSMEITANGTEWNIEARTITDQAKVREIVDKFRS